jgi:hypothetical protein
MFITVFIRTRHRSLCWYRWIQSTISALPYFLKIHSNIIFTSTPRSSTYLQVFQSKYHIHFSYLLCMLHVPLHSLTLITLITCDEASHYEVFSNFPVLLVTLSIWQLFCQMVQQSLIIIKLINWIYQQNCRESCRYSVSNATSLQRNSTRINLLHI